MSYDIRQLQAITEQAIRINAASAISKIQFKLTQAANDGFNYKFVYPVLSVSGSGRMFFDGQKEHLAGEALRVFEEMQRLGLNPQLSGLEPWPGLMRADPQSGKQFLDEKIDCSYYWIAVSWAKRPRGFGDDSFVAQLCESTRLACEKRLQMLKEQIPIKIAEAAGAGVSWVNITKVFAHPCVTPLSGFNGTKDSLSGVERAVFDYLAENKLQPRLFQVPGTLRLADLLDAEGTWHHLIAQWHKEPAQGQ